MGRSLRSASQLQPLVLLASDQRRQARSPCRVDLDRVIISTVVPQPNSSDWAKSHERKVHANRRTTPVQLVIRPDFSGFLTKTLTNATVERTVPCWEFDDGLATNVRDTTSTPKTDVTIRNNSRIGRLM